MGQGFRRTFGDEFTARVAALGAEVNHPVHALDHFQVVLDHDHRIAGIHQALEHLQQALHVGEMQAGGRLIQDVERAARGALGEFGGQLDALGLAAGEGGGGLTDPHVA